jgi:hypothetical protein
MGSVPSRQAGTASGINNAVSRTAGLLAITVPGSLALLVFKANLEEATARLAMTPFQRQTLSLAADRLGDSPSPSGLDSSTMSAVNQAIHKSPAESFHVVETVCAALAILGGGIAFFAVEAGSLGVDT